MTRSRCTVALLALVASLAVNALTAGSALASGKPFVETEPASAVEETTATLNGVVNPNGAETKYYFEYGTTTSYGSKTAEVSAGSGISNVEVSKAITGLTARTTYHFRVVAKNANGTSYGADEVLGTTGRPTVATLPATKLTKTSATLNGTVNPNGLETKYHFEYGKNLLGNEHSTPEVSVGAGIKSVEVSSAISGLTENTRYFYKLVATNGKGTSTSSPNAQFTTPAIPEFTVSKGAVIGTKFTFGTSGSFGLQTPSKRLSCEKIYGVGIITGAKEVEARLTFEKCGTGGGYECHSSGLEKVIESETLAGKLVYVSKEPKKVGLLLEGPASVFAKFVCGTVLTEWKGDLIGDISPLNVLTPTLSSEYKQREAIQEPHTYEGTTRSSDQLVWAVGADEEDVGFEGGLKLTFIEREVEVKA
jgi:hypothetical protein